VDVVGQLGNLNLAADPHEQLVHLIKGLPSPSTYAHRVTWSKTNLLWKDVNVLQNHCTPAPALDHLHVTLTDETLAQIYQRHQDGFDFSELKVSDFDFAFNIAQFACKDDPHEDNRKDEMRDVLLTYLCPRDTDAQQSSTRSSVRGGEIKTDGGKRRQYPVQELFAYATRFGASVDFLKNSTLPTILIAMSGPHVIVLCFAWTGEYFQLDYLSSISLFPSLSHLVMQEQARF